MTWRHTSGMGGGVMNDGDDGLRGESGLSLIEVLAAIVIAALITVAAYGLFGSSMNFLIRSAQDSSKLSDTMNAYWTLERLAQTSNDVGTETLTSNNSGTYISGTTNGPVPVLAVRVASLTGIVPSSSAVYQAAAAGDFVCVGVVPVNGVPKLCLFPGGDAYNPSAQPAAYPPAGDITPIDSFSTNFSGTQFVVLPAAGLTKSAQFQVMFTRKTNHVGPYGLQVGSNLQTITFQFMLGPFTF